MGCSVVLLSAGYATRLYPLTRDRPKALLPLGQGVILDKVLQSVGAIPDVTHRILVTNHRFAPQFERWRRQYDPGLVLVDDGTERVEERLGAVRDLELALVEGEVKGEVLVIGTDNLFSWSMASFVQRARSHHPAPCVALTQALSQEMAAQAAVVSCERSGRIRTFVEKPVRPRTRQIALCVYYFPSSILQAIRTFLKSGGNADAPGYFVEWLIQHQDVYGVMMRGRWFDIGTPGSYKECEVSWNVHRTVSAASSPA